MISGPAKLSSKDRYDAFANNEVLHGKKKGHLPAMGWNSWNAFGSNNTEELTKIMADKLVELGLDKLGYQYVVLDDGCYKPERVEGRLVSNPEKFPSGFGYISDYIHSKGLKFGMYNDIGEKLCSGAMVGTCGFENVDTQDYVNWNIDFIKVDNCYYLWDNATFSNPDNAKYVFTPNIKSVRITSDILNESIEKTAILDGILTGTMACIRDDYVTGIGTFDGTAPLHSPLDERSSELRFEIDVEQTGKYQLYVNYATDKIEGTGSWLQVAVLGEDRLFFDGFLEETKSSTTFEYSKAIEIELKAGKNVLRLMNHRRQENTLQSYATFLKGLNEAKPGHDIIFSICEWGKTHPQNWGYKVGDSWRILNDITFQVGDDGDNGQCRWLDNYTTCISAQYNKAVVMDEYAGLDKGWNDPDMLVVGMDGVGNTLGRTHMALWCMMNSPLMLGMDLRRVEKGDDIYNIIANERLIAIDQDELGIQAKRVFCSIEKERPDHTYVKDINRVDILAKPLADNSVAVCFVNVSEKDTDEEYSISVRQIIDAIGHKMVDSKAWENASAYVMEDLWTGEKYTGTGKAFAVDGIKGCDHVIWKISGVV